MRNPAPRPSGAPRAARLARALPCVLLLLPAAACSERAAPATAWVPAAARAQPAAAAADACVHFTRLQAFLPSEPRGFRRLRATASTGKYGEVSVSEAEQVFVSSVRRDVVTGRPLERRQLSVRIVDTSLTARMAQAIRAAAHEARVTAAVQGAHPRTTPLVYDNALGYLSHDADREGRLEAMLLVGERFLVAVTGHGYDSPEEARAVTGEVLGDIDLTGMSRLARPSIALKGR